MYAHNEPRECTELIVIKGAHVHFYGIFPSLALFLSPSFCPTAAISHLQHLTAMAQSDAALAFFLRELLIALQTSRYPAVVSCQGLSEWMWRTVELATGVARHRVLMRSAIIRAFYKGIRAEIYFYLRAYPRFCAKELFR